jgi:hypothetical protein
MSGHEAKQQKAPWALLGAAATALHVLVLSFATAPTRDATPEPALTLDVSFELLREQPPTEIRPSAPQARRSAPTATSASPAPGWALTSVPKEARVRTSRPTEAAASVPKTVSEPDSTTAASQPLPRTDTPAHEVAAEGSTHNTHGAHRLTASPTNRSQSRRVMTLASKPRLLSAGATCQGVFATPESDIDKVTLVLSVNPDGTALATSVRTSSATSRAALEHAANVCARRLRFEPARSADGAVVAASSIVSLTISKRPSFAAQGTRRHGAI